ncbi:unnamed protein product, partial [Rotaria sp. Silwood2]
MLKLIQKISTRLTSFLWLQITKILLFLSFINSLDEQFIHLHIHSPPVMTTSAPIPYPHPTPMINSHIQMVSYNYLHPPSLLPPSYAIPTGSAFYQSSSPSTATIQQSLTTLCHIHHSQILSGLPPHAPIAPQRTVNFTTTTAPTNNNNNNTNTYQQHSQRLSSNSIQAKEMNIQWSAKKMAGAFTPCLEYCR